MKTFQQFEHQLESIPLITSWYLADLSEMRGRQELFTRQSPQKLKVLREQALIESAISSNRIEGVEIDQERIAEIYREAGQHDKALERAERGTQAFPEKTDSRLREFLAEEYHRRHRHKEAMEHIWNLYTDAPNLGTYRQLKEHTVRSAGKSVDKQTEEWSEWRERALRHLRAMLDERRKGIKNRGNFSAWWGAGDNSTLVEIYICGKARLMKLSRLRKRTVAPTRTG